MPLTLEKKVHMLILSHLYTLLHSRQSFQQWLRVLTSIFSKEPQSSCNNRNTFVFIGVAVEAVGYLLEELRNPSVLEQFKADVANANIFIGSLIFVQELADKVQNITS